jgi:periplasmic protein TonB
MSAHALHFPERSQLLRWAAAGLAIVLAHAAAVAALVLWSKRTPPVQPIIPAIMVSFEPAAPVSPIENDQPVAKQETPQIDPTPEPPKEEARVEPPPPEEVAPPPPRPTEIALPKPEPKPVEKKPVEKKLVEKKPVERKPVEKKPVEIKRVERSQPPQEASARVTAREAPRRSSVAASNAYASLVYGHLQRFKSYPASANGASGQAVAEFVLSRTGSVLSARIVRSSGNAALDAAALASVRSANPFPPFPAEKTGSQDSFDAPFKF